MSLSDIAVQALEDMKAQEISCLDVSEYTDVMDTMIVASGTSNRHVKAIADNLATTCKSEGFKPIGIEGMDTAEWVLVDLGDTVVHIMLPATRVFYDLEKLWSGFHQESGDVPS